MSEESEDDFKYQPITDAARIDKYMAQLLAADIISAGNKELPLCMGDDGPEQLMLMADLAARACKAVDEMAGGEKYWKSLLEINAFRAKRGAKPVWPDDE
jgi:hypothetical protein